MKQLPGLSVLTAFVMMTAPAVFAQGPGASPDSLASARLAKLFGTDRAFTATAVMSMKEGGKKGVQTMEMEFATLAGKVRTEIDMTKGSMAGADNEAKQQMAAMGMSRIVSISRPDLKKTFMIYPGLRAYCEITQNVAEKIAEKTPKIEKKELGRETLDGHPCVKQQVTMTEEGGQSLTALMWEATDLGGFPIQTQMTTEKNGEVTTRFTNIKNEKPAASLFDPPTGFQRYGSMQEMMMGAMQKQMQGFGR